MATYETTLLSLLWSSDGKVLHVSAITKITDNKSGELTLEVNEDIKVTSDAVRDGKFLGWVSLQGNSYPVVQVGSSRFIVGIGGDVVEAGGPVPDSAFSASTFTVCFFPGTLIATPSGERKVEELVSGDLVLSGDSGAIPATWLGRKLACSVTVKWIGRQTVSTLFGPAERLMPVRFAAGSLGGGGGNSFSRIAI